MNKNNFDFLRFCFAFIVVLRHIVDLSQSSDLLKFKPFLDSYTPVTGFFIISGFLISKSYTNTNRLYDYFVKRAKRLIPAYVISVAGAAILLSFFSVYPLYVYFSNKYFFAYLITNLLFLNFLQPCLPGVFITNPDCAVNGALWTIKVEVLFYLFIPFAVYLLNKCSIKLYGLIFIYGISLMYKHILESSGNHNLLILSRQTPGFLCYFACGMSFLYFYDFYYKNKHKLLILCIPIYVIEYYFNLEIFRPISFAVIIFYCAYTFPRLNTFGKYGDFSYGIYVFHFTVIQLFVQYKLFNTYNPYVISTIVVTIVILLGMLSWNFIEKPFLQRNTIKRIIA